MSKNISNEAREIALLLTSLNLDTVQTSSLKSPLVFSGKKQYETALNVIKSILQVRQSKLCMLDPFAGTGTFLLAGVGADCNTYGIELDNYIYWADTTLFSEVNQDKLQEYFEKVKAQSKDTVMQLYKTKCECGAPAFIKKLYFDPATKEFFKPKRHREFKDGKNITFMDKCPKCKAKTKAFDADDMLHLEYCEGLDISKFPSHELIENSRINITKTTGANFYDCNFNSRSKYALLTIQEAINSLPTSKERDVIELALVLAISLARICIYGSSTENLYHKIVEKAQESNVWRLFETKFKGIVKYKAALHRQLGINLQNKLHFKEGDCVETIKRLDKKFDLIYTDPPYADQVPYLEKNQYYRDWLACFYDKDRFSLTSEMLDAEIVISNSPQRKNKGKEEYLKDIDRVIKVFSSSLNDNGILIFDFKLGKDEYFRYYSSFINSCRKYNLELVNVFKYSKNNRTFKKQSANANTLTSDFIMLFSKLKAEDGYWYIEDENCENLVVQILYEKLDPKNNSGFKELDINEAIKLCAEQLKERLSLAYISQDIYSRINQTIKENFYISDKNEVSIDLDRLYFGLEPIKNIFFKLYDLLPNLIGDLLSKQGKFQLDDLYIKIAEILNDKAEESLRDAFKNKAYKSAFDELINLYCTLDNGFYVKRKVSNKKYSASTDITLMTGTDFEKLIMELLKALHYTKLIKKGGSGDRGVDIIGTDPKDRTVYIQCKRWVSSVDATPIQRLHSMQLTDKADRAICVTTSKYTKEAREVAKLTNVQIIDGYELLSYLEANFPKKYFISSLHVTQIEDPQE